VHVHQRLGRLPLAEVVAPAIAAARGGTVITPFVSDSPQLMFPVLRDSPAGTALFLDDGRVLAAGRLHRNPEMADFLETLPRDPRGFYGGDHAETIERDMLEGGGLMTRADLERYEVIERRPLSVAYRGRHVLTNPPPALGGSLMALRLLLQEATDLSRCAWGSRPHVIATARALEQAVRLLRRQHRSGLVHDQETRVLQQAADDLHPLALADRERVHVPARVERKPVMRRHLAYPLRQIAHRDLFVDSERDVLGHGQGIEQREMLEHHADTQPARLGRRPDLDDLSVPPHFAGIGAQHAVHDLHQGRFSGPVLAEKRVDFTGS